MQVPEGDRRAVLRTTKVRAPVKGDSSWIQRQGQDAPEVEDEDKPWLAEMRTIRSNKDSSEPIDYKTSYGEDTSSTLSTDSSKTSGYLIRGVFTKTDTKPASASTNGYIGTSGFTKKASENYKKIAPHTVRSSVEKSVTELTGPSLSADEQERRTEAASKLLDNSARKQRSYVLSAAKKYETTPGKEDSSAAPAAAFVAKRVVISDDEDPGSTSVYTLKQSEEMSVDEPIPPPPRSSAPNAESTAAAKPKLTPKPSPKQLDKVTTTVTVTEKVSTPKSTTTRSVNETIFEATSVAPVATLKTPETTKPKTDPTPTPSPKPKTLERTSALNDNDLLDLSVSPPSTLVDPVPTPTDLLTGDSLPKTEKTKGSLDMLAIDVIPINTNTDKLSTHNRSTKIEITQTVVQSKTDVKSIDSKAAVKTSTLKDQDLLDLNGSTTQNVVKPIPPTTTDLLTGGSLPKTQKTTKSLDLLASDVIPIDTNNDILSTYKTQSKVTTHTTVTQTKTVEKSSADLFDPIQIVKESTKSNDVQNQTVAVTFEQKSSKSSSPWDKWMVPSEHTITEESTSTTKEEKELEPDTKKNLVYIKQYVNSDPSRNSTSRYTTDYDYVTSSSSNYSYSSLPSDYDYVTSSSSSYSYSSLPSTANMTECTYCKELVGNDSKITIEHLKISCHPECFKCGICSTPMGDFLNSMFLHRGTVHCERCYANVI